MNQKGYLTKHQYYEWNIAFEKEIQNWKNDWVKTATDPILTKIFRPKILGPYLDHTLFGPKLFLDTKFFWT